MDDLLARHRAGLPELPAAAWVATGSALAAVGHPRSFSASRTVREDPLTP
ncbi:hypothetical protein [Streptomyces sp.]